MNRFPSMLAALVLGLALTGASFSAYFADRFNTTATPRTGVGYLAYTGTVAMGSDSTSTHYTKGMWLGDLSQEHAYLYAVLSAAGDVDVTPEYSFDCKTWTAGTEVHDALSNTAKNDTVDVVAGAVVLAHRTNLWIRIAFDGQAANTSGKTITWRLFIPNPGGLDLRRREADLTCTT